jgi:hypothetical protein
MLIVSPSNAAAKPNGGNIVTDPVELLDINPSNDAAKPNGGNPPRP